MPKPIRAPKPLEHINVRRAHVAIAAQQKTRQTTPNVHDSDDFIFNTRKSQQ